MKKIILLLAVVLLCQSRCLLAQPGMLDNTFGNNGIATTAVGAAGSQIFGMAIQSDWSIVVGGFAFNANDTSFALARYQPNGSLDSSFGTNGLVTTTIGNNDGQAYSLALQPDGKIVLGGFAWTGSKYNFALVRYNTNGSLDNTFGNNGKVTTSIGSGSGQGFSLALQPDWSIVLGGSAFNGSNYDFALARYKINGTLDSSFGNNGTVITPIGSGNANINSVMIQSDWSIVVGGIASNGSNNNFALARYDSTGSLDHTFGTDGKVLTAIGSGNNGANAIVLQPDGKIVATGSAYIGAINQFALARYNPNGTPDSAFGTNGTVSTSIGDSADALYSVFIQPDGRIVSAGSLFNGAKENYGMVRYNIDGTLDNNFGTGGKVITVMSTGNNESYAVNMQPDGKIVSSGYANNGTNDNFSIARYISGLNLGVLDFSAAGDNILIYPNPVAQNATLEYTLKNAEDITIKLMDIQGNNVETFISNQKQEAGDYKLPLLFPQTIASGSYIIAITSKSGNISIKIVK